jgi:hypothetical protein
LKSVLRSSKKKKEVRPVLTKAWCYRFSFLDDFDLDKVGSQRQHGDDLELDNIVDHMVKVVEGYIENLADMMSCSKCSKSGVEVKKQRIKEL